MKDILKAYLMTILIVFMILFNAFVLNTYRLSSWYPAIYWVGLSVLAYFLFGRRNRESAKFTDIIQLVFIYCMVYELIIYLSGLFLGFVRSPYSMQFRMIIKNVLPPLIMIIAEEFVRNAVITRYKKDKFVICAITLVIAAFEIFYNIGAYDLKYIEEIIKMLTVLVGGTLTKNILCSYLAYRADYKPAILYRCVFELILYIVPIFPNLGEYIEAMVAMIFPITLMVTIMGLFQKKQYRKPKKNLFETLLLWIPSVAVIVFIVVIQSGILRYRTMAIGSQSMYPNIKKGDVVVVDQIRKPEEYKNIIVGEVLVFKHDNIIIVHRVTKITEKDGRLVFNTKGDNNNTADTYDIDQSNVVGVARFKIPFIGYPSIWLSETLNN